MMGIVLIGLQSALDASLDVAGSSIARVGSLALLVSTGLMVYLAGLELFGVMRLKELVASVRGKL